MVQQQHFPKTFRLEPIESVYDYMNKVKQERENKIILPTEDGIGVAYKNRHNKEECEKNNLFNFAGEESLEIKVVKGFFENASFKAKLVFLRDAQSKGLIYDNDEVKLYIKEQLRFLGLNNEAVRLTYPS